MGFVHFRQKSSKTVDFPQFHSIHRVCFELEPAAAAAAEAAAAADAAARSSRAGYLAASPQ